MALHRFEFDAEDTNIIAPFYSRNQKFICVMSQERTGVGIRITVHYDGYLFHPLIETVDVSGAVTSGRLLRPNVRLVKAVEWADKWLSENVRANGPSNLTRIRGEVSAN